MSGLEVARKIKREVKLRSGRKWALGQQYNTW